MGSFLLALEENVPEQGSAQSGGLQPAHLLASAGSCSAFQCASAEKAAAETQPLIRSSTILRWFFLRGGKGKSLFTTGRWRNSIGQPPRAGKWLSFTQQHTSLKKYCAVELRLPVVPPPDRSRSICWGIWFLCWVYLLIPRSWRLPPPPIPLISLFSSECRSSNSL